MRGLIGPLIACLATAVLARRVIDVVQVRGCSMLPTLRPGDRLVVLRNWRHARCGEVVLALDPRDAGRELVKRVAAVGPEGVALRGDNPALSTDARTFGSLPSSAIRWRVIARCWPPHRLGRMAPPPEAPAFEG